MPHMLSQEHMGFVDALRYGTARNQATIAAALSAIGADTATLVLTHTGDGVWTLTSSLTMPTNVSLFIPAGVTVFRPAGTTLTVQGVIIANNYAWEVGPGSTVKGIGGAAEISNLFTKQFRAIGDVAGLVVQNPNQNNYVTIHGDVGSNFPALSFGRGAYAPPSGPDSLGWRIAMNNDVPTSLYFYRPGVNPHMTLTSSGMWVGNGSGYTVPTHLLQCQNADVVIPGGGPWGSWSDSRLKTVARVFADGLAKILALPDPIVYTYNGKGGSIADGKEYIGMIAQDVQPVAPYMVYTYEAPLEPGDPQPTTLLAMNNGAMVYALINAVRELSARLEALETLTGTRFADLEGVAHTHTGTGSAAGEVPYVPPPLAAAREETPATPRPAARRTRRAT